MAETDAELNAEFADQANLRPLRIHPRVVCTLGASDPLAGRIVDIPARSVTDRRSSPDVATT